MATVPNTTPETLGAGAIVKFNGNCTVFAKLVKGDASKSMGTISANQSFEVETPGDYLFKAADGCCATVTYEVLYAGEDAGPQTALEIAAAICADPAAAEILKGCVDTDTQNSHILDADGNLVITSPDGSESTTYVINKPDTLLGPYTDADGDGIYTAEVLDADGTPTGETVDSDFNALISSPHPDPIPDTFMSATVDPDTGDITLQYMNADGPVGDPIVIPAPCECLKFGTELGIDAGGSASLAVSEKMLHDYMEHYTTQFEIFGPFDVPSGVSTVVHTHNVAEAGLWLISHTSTDNDSATAPTQARNHVAVIAGGNLFAVQTYSERAGISTNQAYANGSGFVQLDAGDPIDFLVRQDSGATRAYSRLRITLARIARKD